MVQECFGARLSPAASTVLSVPKNSKPATAPTYARAKKQGRYRTDVKMMQNVKALKAMKTPPVKAKPVPQVKKAARQKAKSKRVWLHTCTKNVQECCVEVTFTGKKPKIVIWKRYSGGKKHKEHVS